MSVADLALVVFASSLGMSIKSATGMGYPLLAIPLLSLVLGVEAAVVVVITPNTMANLLMAWQLRRNWNDTRDLPVLMATGVVGGVIGTLVLVAAPEEPLLVFLCGLILFFVGRSVWSPDFSISPATGRRWSPVAGLAAGVAQGAVGVSGPVVVSWLHAYRLKRDAFILSITVVFLLASSSQVATLVALGGYDRERLVGAAAALVPVVVITPFGEYIRSRLSSAMFERAVLVMLMIAAVTLFARVVT